MEVINKLKQWIAWKLGIISPSRLVADREYYQKVMAWRRKRGYG